MAHGGGGTWICFWFRFLGSRRASFSVAAARPRRHWRNFYGHVEAVVRQVGAGWEWERERERVQQNFATCRLLAALINCHEAPLLLLLLLLFSSAAAAGSDFNLAQILCKNATLRRRVKEAAEGGAGRRQGRAGQADDTCLGWSRCSSLEC